MKTDNPKLDGILREARATPGLPPRFQQSVWRRIEGTEIPAQPTFWLDALAGLILRPHFALTATIALVLVGVFLGAVAGRDAARHDAQINYLASVAPHSGR